MRDVYTRLMSGPIGIAAAPARERRRVHVREPRLAVAWEPRRGSVYSSLKAILSGPKPPRGFPTGTYFGSNWVLSKFPARTVMASIAIHVAMFVIPWPQVDLGTHPMSTAEAASTNYELTWELPARDLPPIKTAGPVAKPVPPGKPDQPSPTRGADAFHPRQTIISAPKAPTHPRQTLIQPEAPQLAPKFLPQLPNIVQWAATPQPAKPRLQINPEVLARLRPKAPAQRHHQEIALPDVPNAEKMLGDVNIGASELAARKPMMPVPQMSAPLAGPARAGQEAAAPELNPSMNGGDSGAQRLIALSATPGSDPKAPVPPGNLQARITISPEGTQPGAPAGSTSGPYGAGGAASGSGADAAGPGISIRGGNPSEAASVSGLGAGNAGAPKASSLPAHPNPPALSAPSSTRTPATPGFDRLKPGDPPESIFASQRVYTLHVNMPNLTSATGSWVLSFVELLAADAQEAVRTAQSRGAAPQQSGADATDLAGPVPTRKVDPKYPPALVQAHVEGEVVLYAIIRRDGSVDSIMLMKGLDPDLDANAMQALARWKFRPAERAGAPVELEAVVHIPFHGIVPRY